MSDSEIHVNCPSQHICVYATKIKLHSEAIFMETDADHPRYRCMAVEALHSQGDRNADCSYLSLINNVLDVKESLALHMESSGDV